MDEVPNFCGFLRIFETVKIESLHKYIMHNKYQSFPLILLVWLILKKSTEDKSEAK